MKLLDAVRAALSDFWAESADTLIRGVVRMYALHLMSPMEAEMTNFSRRQVLSLPVRHMQRIQIQR